MSRISIFAVVQESLISAKYEEDEQPVFYELIERWTDPDYLYDFFEEHESDLKSGFYREISIEEAVEKTIDETYEFEAELHELSEKGKQNIADSLQTLFKPLSNNEYRIGDLLQKNKAYGPEAKSWLRIYAIRITPNTFVISGGAIKLTKSMNERDHLKEELKRLNALRDFLKENELLDESDFEYVELWQ